MKLQCTFCRQPAPPETKNVPVERSVCPVCGGVFRGPGALNIDAVEAMLHDPPSGTWYREEGDRTVVGASTRTPAVCLHLTVACLMSYFAVWVLAKIAPAGMHGEFSIAGLLAFLFVGAIILSAVWFVALLGVMGKAEVVLGPGFAETFTGVGRLGNRRSFDWTAIWTIYDKPIGFHLWGFFGDVILEGRQRIKVGPITKQSRRRFMVMALQYLKIRGSEPRTSR